LPILRTPRRLAKDNPHNQTIDAAISIVNRQSGISEYMSLQIGNDEKNLRFAENSEILVDQALHRLSDLGAQKLRYHSEKTIG
jgi:hypothetical protein